MATLEFVQVTWMGLGFQVQRAWLARGRHAPWFDFDPVLAQ